MGLYHKASDCQQLKYRLFLLGSNAYLGFLGLPTLKWFIDTIFYGKTASKIIGTPDTGIFFHLFIVLQSMRKNKLWDVLHRIKYMVYFYHSFVKYEASVLANI